MFKRLREQAPAPIAVNFGFLELLTLFCHLSIKMLSPLSKREVALTMSFLL